MKKNIIILFFLLILPLFSTEKKQNYPDIFSGYWITPDKKVVIEIKKENNIYVGFVKWLKDPSYPKGDSMEGVIQYDRNNPDENLRERKVLGLQVIGNLVLSEDQKKLKNGWIYDSWNGRLYYGSAEFINKNLLKLRGSIDSFGILGYSMYVERVTFSPDIYEN